MTQTSNPVKKWTCVHLSDIHFKRRSADGAYFVNQDLQDQLILDLKRLKELDSSFEAVLVSGDIAFSGQAEEYEQANAFLSSVCNAVGIQHSDVWTVPGNHDVNRNEIGYSIRRWHEEVKKSDYFDHQRELDAMLRDQQADHLILGTLKNYNTFAERYSCQSTLKTPLFWHSEKHALNDGSSLKIRGVNSAFACDALDRRGSGLFVGQQQVTLPQEDGVAWIVMCHHPTAWLADGNRLIETLQNRAAVVLFGHEHEARNYMHENLLVLHAGAVNPDQGEKPQAAYNVVSFWVDLQQSCERQLVVEVQRRIFDPEQSGFVAHYRDGSFIFTRRIALPAFQLVAPTAVSRPNPPEGEAASMPKYDEAQVKRRLIYYFFDLVEGARMTIVSKLELITPDIAALTGRDLFLAIIDEAQKKGKLTALWQEVAQRIPDMPDDPSGTVPPHA